MPQIFQTCIIVCVIPAMHTLKETSTFGGDPSYDQFGEFGNEDSSSGWVFSCTIFVFNNIPFILSVNSNLTVLFLVIPSQFLSPIAEVFEER